MTQRYNNENLGFSLEYPSYWQQEDEDETDPDAITFSPPGFPDERRRPVVSIAAVPSGNMNLEQFTQTTLCAMAQQHKFELTDHPLGGQPGKRLLYNMEVEGAEAKLKQVWTIRSNVSEAHAFVVTFATPPENYEKYVEEFDEIVSSVTFHAVTAKPKLAISRLVLRPFFSKEHGFAVNIPGNFVPDQFPSTSSSSNATKASAVCVHNVKFPWQDKQLITLKISMVVESLPSSMNLEEYTQLLLNQLQSIPALREVNHTAVEFSGSKDGYAVSYITSSGMKTSHHYVLRGNKVYMIVCRSDADEEDDRADPLFDRYLLRFIINISVTLSPNKKI